MLGDSITAQMATNAASLPFPFVAERLWLDFVNTDTGGRGTDALHDFGRFVSWLAAARSTSPIVMVELPTVAAGVESSSSAAAWALVDVDEGASAFLSFFASAGTNATATTRTNALNFPTLIAVLSMPGTSAGTSSGDAVPLT